MKKLVGCMLVMAMVITMVGCGKKEEKTENTTQIPNPFTECTTMEEAEEIAGFTMTVPKDMPEGYEEDGIRAIKGDLIDVCYVNGESKMNIRKGIGSDDISGDYNIYDQETSVDTKSGKVTLKGNQDKVNTAVWTNGEYSYSITVNMTNEGISQETMLELVKGIE